MNKNLFLMEELLSAAERGDVERVKELLQCNGVNAQYAEEEDDEWNAPRTALVVACERGHVEAARLLLHHGGETQQELAWAFGQAAWKGHVEVVKMLMRKEATLRL